jgi:ABC-type histidine transport system ATPase subunit
LEEKRLPSLEHLGGVEQRIAAMAASAFRPPAKVADEPEHLLEDDFVEGRLELLVRLAVETDASSTSKGGKGAPRAPQNTKSPGGLNHRG